VVVFGFHVFFVCVERDCSLLRPRRGRRVGALSPAGGGDPRLTLGRR
jgi:hypothetical protein